MVGLIMIFVAVFVLLKEQQSPGVAESTLSTPLVVNIKTDKKYYLMDPYYWVYSASKEDLPGPSGNPHWWPEEGYPRTVNFSVYLNNLNGSPAEVEGVVYQVVYGTGRLLTTGSATYEEPGVFRGSFVLTEASLGGASFTGWEPREMTVKALVGDQVVKRQKFHVGRWGCDRCHLEASLARQIYPWGYPTGGYWGPHGWYGQLGGAGNSNEMFNLSNLTDPEKTHTPADLLTGTYGHEYTIQKQCGETACSPCHHGSGRLRYPWSTPPYYTHPGEKVECTYCHGMEGGYLPSGVLDWSSTKFAGYFDNWGKGSKWKDNAGFSAIHGDCTSVHCHGHIVDDAEGDIEYARPVCTDCH
ncbi:MAG: hypothetical protein C4570_01275 [Ammonifex sp.]|nr:MAG: hypothetical protein C4570_01275 [Ammonifex sp.]